MEDQDSCADNDSDYLPATAKKISPRSTINQNHKHNNKISEPLDLMPKSINSIDESIKTGGTVAFLQLERFMLGKQFREKLAGINGAATAIVAPSQLPISEQIA